MKKVFVLIVSMILLVFVTLTMSACSITDILNDSGLVIRDDEIDRIIAENDAMTDCLEQINSILNERGFKIVSEETDNGVVYSIVEKTEESENEEPDNSEDDEEDSAEDDEDDLLID